MKRVCIVSRNFGYGLEQDVRILRKTLSTIPGVATSQYFIPGWNLEHKGWRTFSAITGQDVYDLVIFCETIGVRFAKSARTVFIPNPEFLEKESAEQAREADEVWLKTRGALDLLSGLNDRMVFTGFCSADIGWSPPARRRREFLHVRGKSWLKGTDALVEAWQAHPEWPRLTIVARGYTPTVRVLPPNVRLLGELPRGEVLRLMRQTMFHLCPSEAEGYGHCIAESLSTGAIVATTDAPPMNEFGISPRFLLGYSHTERKDRGIRYFVTRGAIETACESMLGLDSAAIEATSRQNRNAWEVGAREFSHRIAARLAVILPAVK
jgi:hypothetical protein